MKIGLISSMGGAAWGGSEELWCALSELAIDHGHQVSVSIYDWGMLPEKVKLLKDKGISIHLRNRIQGVSLKEKINAKLNQLVRAEKQLSQFVKKYDQDALLISLGALCELEIQPILSFLENIQTPYFIVVHSNLDYHTVPFNKISKIRKVLTKARVVYFVSNRLIEQIERQIAVKLPNAIIVKNPINMDHKGIMPYPESELINFAVVGSLQVGIKGQAYLLQILSSEKWQNRNWVLNIYGKGPDEQLIHELIAMYNLTEKVFLRGYVNDVRGDIWKSSHILLMPSFKEGLPIALIEAMLCGRTAVVTDVGGNAEIIKDDSIGFVADAPTNRSYERMLDEAWKKKEEWKTMGAKSFSVANSFFGDNPMNALLKELVDLKKG